jgi:predicted phage terminase large subunit-like protein
VAQGEVYHRQVGELLQSTRDKMQTFDEIRREIGSRVFAAQYQQNPTPPDGNFIKAAWIQRYPKCSDRKYYGHVILSCDPAGKAGPRNDYTAITIAGVLDKRIHLLHVVRGHWTILQMRDRIITLKQEWEPNLVLIEDTSSGMGLVQLIAEHSSLNVIGRHPKADKETRMSRHQGRFEAGRILLPLEAPWLAEFESERFAFPGGRYDDQVDALLLLLDWFSDNEHYINPVWVAPISVTRADLGLPPLVRDWSCRY